MDLLICLFSQIGKTQTQKKRTLEDRLWVDVSLIWSTVCSAKHWLRRRDLQPHNMAIFPNRLNSPIEFKDHQFIHVINWSKFVPPQEFSLDLVRYSLWNFSQKLWCVSSNTSCYHFIFYIVPLKPKHMCNLSLHHIKKFRDYFL